MAHLPADVGIALRGLKKSKKSKKEKKKPESEATGGGEVAYDEIPEVVTRMAKDIHRRLETTWHAVGERECAPSFLEMEAVKVLIFYNNHYFLLFLPFLLINDCFYY